MRKSVLPPKMSAKELEDSYNYNRKMYLEIKELCEQYKIEFVIVFTPHLKYYRENHWAREHFKRYEDLIRELNIRYLDCRDWVPDEYFRDGVHLLPVGATFFTPLLLKALDEKEYPLHMLK